MSRRGKFLSKKIAQMVGAVGDDPLSFMLKIMRHEENSLELRLEAAKSAAPYCHPKLGILQVTKDDDLTLEDLVLAAMKPRRPEIVDLSPTDSVIH